MSELADGSHDRFGCAQIATVVFAGLVMVLGILWVAGGGDFSTAIGTIIGGDQTEQGPGPDAGNNAPPRISERLFETGATEAGVSGAMTYDGDLSVDDGRSYVDSEGLAWIAYGGVPSGPNGEPGPQVLIAFNEPENSVTVAVGNVRATGQDDACDFDVQVTPTLVSGSISCQSVDTYDGDDLIGTSTIEVEFSAGSPPGGGLETDGPAE